VDPEVNDEDHHRVREHVGNTHEVAKAIGDGIHEAHPGANVECVAVGDAAPELIKSTDLLIVGGPTHIHHMSTDSAQDANQGRNES
jgi:flavodoxin